MQQQHEYYEQEIILISNDNERLIKNIRTINERSHSTTTTISSSYHRNNTATN